MRFVFKLMVWGFIALLILPSVSPLPEEQQQAEILASAETEEPALNSGDAIRIAAGIAGDIQGLCARDPDLCQTGQKLVSAAINRAQDGAKVLASMVESHRAEKRENTDGQTTGSVD